MSVWRVAAVLVVGLGIGGMTACTGTAERVTPPPPRVTIGAGDALVIDGIELPTCGVDTQQDSVPERGGDGGPESQDPYRALGARQVPGPGMTTLAPTDDATSVEVARPPDPDAGLAAVTPPGSTAVAPLPGAPIVPAAPPCVEEGVL